MLKIQRVPQGLLQLLRITGPSSPTDLAETVQPTLDLTQFYANQQLQTRTSSDPAAVQGSGTGVTLSATQWTVLHGFDCGVTLAAAMTALSVGLIIQRGTQGFVGVNEDVYTGAFSAGGLFVVSWRAPYPLICPPGTVVFGGLNKLAGVANAALSCTAEFGVL